MKRFIRFFAMAIMLNVADSVIPPKTEAHPMVSFQVFYDELSPYGHWVYFPTYGYAWIPNDEANFSPYSTNGYWVYTDYGWTWVSDYSWGWAPFHYGRWNFDDDYGWYWIPDYEWAPAWVAWANCPGYYGWTPLGPGIAINTVISSGYRVRPERWVYCHEEYLGRRDISRYYAPRSENLTNISRSTMVGRTNTDRVTHSTFIAGPAPQEVQKATGTPVRQFALAERATPGQAVSTSELSIYKPAINRSTASKPAPSKVTSLSDVKPLPGRTPNPNRTTAPPPVIQRQPREAVPNSTIETQPRQNSRTVNPNPQSIPQRSVPQNNRTITPPREQPQRIPEQAAPRNNPQPQNVPQKETPQQVPPAQRTTPPQREMPPQTEAPAPRQEAPPSHSAPPTAPPSQPHPEHPVNPHQPPAHVAEPPKAPPAAEPPKEKK